jgi:hypothetical protein
LREEAELRHITQILQPAPFLSAKRAPPTHSTQPSTSFVVTCNPQLSAPQKQSQIKMSQIATAVIVEAAAVAIATENANPNAESMAVLKAKDVEHPICTENLRSESSTPVKDVLEAQLVATNQPAGDCLVFVEPVELNFRRSNLIFPI